jgi:hypothetical protein
MKDFNSPITSEFVMKLAIALTTWAAIVIAVLSE